MECKKARNAADCACTYTSCENRGVCYKEAEETRVTV